MTHSTQTLIVRALKAEILDRETEELLARAWRDNRDDAALHRLTTAYLRLAVSTAFKFKRYSYPPNELIQQASLGLMQAADRFDPDKGVRFSTYAIWWIKAALQDYVLRNRSLVRIGGTATQKTLFFNLRRLQNVVEHKAERAGVNLSSEDLNAEIARLAGVCARDVEQMGGRLLGDFSLNAPLSSDEEAHEWIEVLEDEHAAGSVDVEASMTHERLSRVLADVLPSLKERDLFIVTERKLRDKPRTLESLGQELGISKERVRQLEEAAFQKLRRKLEEIEPNIKDLISG